MCFELCAARVQHISYHAHILMDSILIILILIAVTVVIVPYKGVEGIVQFALVMRGQL